MKYKNIKKPLILILCLGLVVLLIVWATTPNTTKESGLFETSEEVIGFSALSVVSALDQTESTPIDQETGETRFNPEEIGSYLPLVNTFMGKGRGFSVEVHPSSHEEYEHRMDIQSIDHSGERVTQELHYNETITEKEGNETESTIKGILVIDGVTYDLDGELEKDNNEESLEMVAKNDDENYVTVNYETEREAGENETEFDYEVYKDDQLVKLTEIEFGQEENETEMSLNFLQDTYEGEYDFEMETDDNEEDEEDDEDKTDEDEEETIEIEYKISESGNVIEEGEYDAYINDDGEVVYTRKEVQNKD